MSRKQKLQLTWIGKEEQPRLEPRILIGVAELSYLGEVRSRDDIFDNVLIQGDNLLALKSLEQSLLGKVKCIYIDPPYNTGSAFMHFDDGLEHSLWLTLLRSRLQLLRSLMSNNGSIWISIDDNECHYLKILLDEIFGRSNFVATIVWQKAYTANQTARHISDIHDYILVYAKDAVEFKMGKILRSEDQKAKFRNPDADPRGPWKAENLSAGKFYSAGQFEITGPTGERFLPPKGRYWRCNEEQYQRWLEDGRITFGLKGEGRPMLKKFLAEMDDGLTATTWWPHEEVGTNKQASIDLKNLLPDVGVFQNPKPEQLLSRILQLATQPGDLVLDSFAGSGTTAAVAHKMGRRWIVTELGDHATTHIVPRLRAVIDGTDTGGISETVGWSGGGGFRFLRLAPSLLERDRWGNWVVSKEYNPAMLAEAMCKHMGFTYAPSQSPIQYWNHGFSSERDFIYVTTQALTHSMLKALSHDVGPDRHLLICCKAFSGKTNEFANLSVRRIPQAVLANCEWGRDDYSLRIANLPKAETVGEDEPPGKQAPLPKRGRRKAVSGAATDLFGQPAVAEV